MLNKKLIRNKKKTFMCCVFKKKKNQEQKTKKMLQAVYLTHAIFGTLGTTRNYLLPQQQAPNLAIDLPTINRLVERLDARQTCETLKTNKDVQDIIPCLKALIEQVDRLNKNYQNMWVLSNYRIGDLRGLHDDILTLHNKVMVRMSVNLLNKE